MIYLWQFCNNRTMARWLINNTNLFFTILKAEKSKTKVLADSVSREDPLSISQVAVFSLCPVAERARELSGVSVIKTLISFMRASPT